ncbi:MAG: MerR family transcriptional regulator [Lentihominibacter sp.]
MKIGAFSEKTQVPVSTIRYYISEELLTPKKGGAQYDFDERNIQEMQLLSELRRMNFTMEEMKRFINVVRMLDSRDELRYRQLQSIFSDKRAELMLQTEKLQGIVNEIDHKLTRLKMEESVMVDQGKNGKSGSVSGIPAEFLSLLRCPVCGGAVSMEHAQIRQEGIVSGEIICQCGYRGVIENGMINVDPDIDLDEDPVFIDDYFGESSFANQDYCIQYEGFLSAQTDFLNVQHKAREWIHDKIMEHDLHPHVILFPDIASLFLYLHIDASYLKDEMIIVMGMSRKGIEASRRHLETLGADLKVLYVISPSNRLPLRKKCVDLMVDYLATFNYAFFYERPLYEFIDSCFADTAVIAGATANYAKGCRSVRNIEESYTRSMKPFITLGMVLDTFRGYGYEVKAQAEMGRCVSLTDFFDYHVEGEAHEIHTFFAVR